jgi:hypothetical protein
MTLTVPTAGDEILASWGTTVATQLNLTTVLSANVTTASSSWGDLTGLSFTCVSGQAYNFEVILTYEHSDTSGGPVIGFNHPGGTCHMLINYAGETSATSSDTEAQNGTDGTGGGSGVATVNGAGSTYFIRAWGRYVCTTSGTFTLRHKRNTAGTLTIHEGSALRVVSD